MNSLTSVPTIDELLKNPAKVAAVTPETAQALLIGLASIQPLLIQRALMGLSPGQAEDGLLTIPDVAARLKLSTYRAYELARQGVLKSVRLGKSVRVKPEDVAAYIAQQGG
jgi:excisionase family DNA binding protein